MTRVLDLELDDGRTLRAYDTGQPDDGRLAVFWHHGTPNIGEPPPGRCSTPPTGSGCAGSPTTAPATAARRPVRAETWRRPRRTSRASPTRSASTGSR